MAASSKFAIAVHVLACLDYAERQWSQEQMNSVDLATSVQTSPVIIRNLLGELGKAKLIHSKEGKGGGFRLARKATRIRLDEVYAAVKRCSILAQSPNPEHKPCTVSCGIKNALNPVLGDVDKAVTASLRKKTLADVVDQIVKG